MTVFWIFMMVVAVCATVVLCFFMDNAEYLHMGDIFEAERSINDKLDHLEELLKEQQKGEQNV